MIKDHSQYGASESQYLIQKRAIRPYKVICGIQTYIDYLHHNLLFFAPEGRINFGMGDVAGLTQTACNYATMLKIPQIPATYRINYLIVGGGGAGEDAGYPPYSGGGWGGQVLTGSFILPASSRLEIYAGAGGQIGTFNPNNSSEPASGLSGQNSTIKKGQLGNTTLLFSASGGSAGGTNAASLYQGGFGGNGVTNPTTYTDGDGNNVYVGGSGIPITSFIDGSTAYYGAGGGGGNPDNGDIAQNGTTTSPNYGLGGKTGNVFAGSNYPTAGINGVVMLSGTSASFGGIGTYVGATRQVVGSNTILTWNNPLPTTGLAGTYNS